jgi:hypothetical protein
MLRLISWSPAVAGLFLAGVAAAHAETPAPPSKSMTETALRPALAQSNKGKADLRGQPSLLGDEELANQRGEGEDKTITIANQNLTSIVSNPSVGGDLTSGDVSLSDNALSSFSGLGNIVINTGSQVSVQSGMNVTINLTQ